MENKDFNKHLEAVKKALDKIDKLTKEAIEKNGFILKEGNDSEAEFINKVNGGKTK